VDLLMASSCTPPFTPVELLDGEPCLDGGLMDNVPIDTVADVPGQTLVLATRRYRGMAPVFARDGRVYVQPSERVPASSWDYTSPARYLKTYDLGRRDGEAFLRTFALGRFEGTGLRDEAPAAPRIASVAGSAAGDSAPEHATVPLAVGDDAIAAKDGGPTDSATAPAPAVAPTSAGAAGVAAAAAEEEPTRALDASAKLAAYRGPMAAGTADDLNSSQPAASSGQ